MTERSLQRRIRHAIDRERTAAALPIEAGVAVAVVGPTGNDFYVNYGLRDRESSLRVTSDTIFESGSLTKAFTAAALVMASRRGRLSLDEPLNAPKPVLGLSDSGLTRDVTVADLLSHRSGIPGNDLLWYFGDMDRADVLRALAGIDVVSGAFRRRFIYNNLTYGALGHLFYELTGMSWPTAITTGVLTPLRMSSTSFQPASDERDVAVPYVGMDRTSRVDVSAIAAAGTIRTSARDLSRWMDGLLNNAVFASDPSRHESISARMFRTEVDVIDVGPVLLRGLEWIEGPLSYGLGWFIGTRRGEQVVFHPALIDGFSHAIALMPERRLGIAVLTNTNLSALPGAVVCSALDSMLEGVEPVAGVYANPSFGSVVIEEHEDELLLRYGRHAWPLLWKRGNLAEITVTAFGLQIPLSVTFAPGPTGGVTVGVPFTLDPATPPQVFTMLSS